MQKQNNKKQTSFCNKAPLSHTKLFQRGTWGIPPFPLTPPEATTTATEGTQKDDADENWDRQAKEKRLNTRELTLSLTHHNLYTMASIAISVNMIRLKLSKIATRK